MIVFLQLVQLVATEKHLCWSFCNFITYGERKQ